MRHEILILQQNLPDASRKLQAAYVLSHIEFFKLQVK